MSHYSGPEIHDDQSDQTNYAYGGEAKNPNSLSKVASVKKSVKNETYQAKVLPKEAALTSVQKKMSSD